MWSLMVIHSSFVRNVWISATPRASSHPFTYPHFWTLLIGNSLLNMMKASLTLVIRLSLTYPHVPDKARMNNNQASYLVSIRLIFSLPDLKLVTYSVSFYFSTWVCNSWLLKWKIKLLVSNFKWFFFLQF